jgi:hypothetical protein
MIESAEIKKEVFVDKQGFAIELQVYSNKIETQKKIKSEVRKYLPKFRINDAFFNDVLQNFCNELTETYKKQNTLNLSGEKLAQLLEFDLSNLINYSEAYKKLKHIKSPSIDKYTIYTETEEELKKLNICNSIIELLKKVETDLELKAYPFEIEKAFKRIITFNIRTNEYEVNWRYIKNEKRQ